LAVSYHARDTVVNGQFAAGMTIVRKLPKAYVHDFHNHGIATSFRSWQISGNENTGRWSMNTGLFLLLIFMFLIFLGITKLLD
jgi:hypothetical protein